MAHPAGIGNEQVEHGVFINLEGLGLLITGAAGIGKSELALELITRGHPLIADDAPLFKANDQGEVIGSCPELLKGFLEIRDLGILNIPALFGVRSVSEPQPLDFIIKLTSRKATPISPEEKLSGRRFKQTVCHTEIPGIMMSTRINRNLAILVETAARNHLLKIKGYNPASEFQSRLNTLINPDNPYSVNR